MKKVLSSVMLALGVGLAAAEFDVNGDFSKLDRNGAPAHWERHAWSGYQPFAKHEYLELDGKKSCTFPKRTPAPDSHGTITNALTPRPAT